MIQSHTQQLNKESMEYYNSLYHLAEISIYKLNPPERPRTEPILRRQLLTRNILIMSSRLITTQTAYNTPEENWLDACFDQLDEDEDYIMEEEAECKDINDKKTAEDDNRLVIAFPFDYVSPTEEDPNSVRKATLYFI